MHITTARQATAIPALALAAALGGSIPQMTAAPVIHEPFAQTAGNLSGGAGGAGLSGNWTVGSGTVNVVSPDTITHGALANSGGQADVLVSGNTNARVSTNTDLATAGLLADGATLWFSMVFQKTGDGGSNEHGGFAFGSSHLVAGASGTNLSASGNAFGFVARGTTIRLAKWTGTTAISSATGTTAMTLDGYSVPTLIVGKIEWGATSGANDKLTLYKGAPNLTLTAGPELSVTGFDQSNFNIISFAQRNSNGTYTFDEIRFGATQADVLPADTVAPALVSITDDKAGGPIGEDVAIITYDLNFDRHMDLASFDTADFDNAGDATATLGTITQPSPTVIRVQVLPTTTGTVQLRIPASTVIKSLAQVNLDTVSALLDDTTITINAGTTSPSTPTANRWWDGATTSGVTNGASGGGNGTWDIGTTTNWDRGAGFESPVAWNNSNGNTAIFSGTTGTVALDGDITLDGLTVSAPTAGTSGYSIGNSGEDNTLTFTGTKTVTTTASGTGTNQDVTITAGIAGSPTMNIAGRGSNTVNNFNLLPGSGVTQTIGTLNMLNTFASNKRLNLGGDSTGNVVEDVTWSSSSNQLMLTKAGTGSWTINQDVLGSSSAGRLYVEQGTLTLGGINNFFTHKVGVATNRESTFTASNQVSKLNAKGTFTIGDNREYFYVQNNGVIAPGPGVETLTVRWNANTDTSGTTGPTRSQFKMESGSTYEWDVASKTSTDVINVQTGGSNWANLIYDGITLKIIDAGVSTPIASTDELTVFTYETGVQTVTRSIGTVTFDTSALGAGWTVGTLALTDDGAGRIYLTGLTFSGGATYTVTYDGNGGTGTAPTDGATYATGASVTLAGSGSLVKSGFVFTGWNTQADGNGTHYNAGASYTMGSANVTFYADWKTPYNVWAATYLPADVSNQAGNHDNDTLTNLQEFAFGFDPTVSDGGGTLTISGGAITQNGPPQIHVDPVTGQYFLRYTRRADYLAVGLTYNAQFAPNDLSSFVTVAGGSVVATGTGAGGVAIEAVAIEFPDALPGSGRKARFGRVEVPPLP